jgi:hypothetical protein
MSLKSTIALFALAAGCIGAAPAMAKAEIRFEARTARSGLVAFRIKRDHGDHDRGNWRVSVPFSDLDGISVQSFDKPGPIRFAYVRPAGRFDCNGTVEEDHGLGTCTFSPDARFAGALTANGIAAPDEDDYFGLAMSGVRIELLDALKKEGLGTPTLHELVSLGIFKVTPDYVHQMAGIGKLDFDIGDLVSFKIFRVTPEMVREFGALGYRELQAKDLVQFKFHGISAKMVRDLAELGYRDIPIQTLVRMKIFGVTPDYIRRVRADWDGKDKPSAEQLVRMRISAMIPRFDWPRQRARGRSWSYR